MMQVQARPNSPRTAGKGPPRPQRGLLAPHLLPPQECLPSGQSPWRHRIATRWQVGCRVLASPKPPTSRHQFQETLMPVGFAGK